MDRQLDRWIDGLHTCRTAAAWGDWWVGRCTFCLVAYFRDLIFLAGGLQLGTTGSLGQTLGLGGQQTGLGLNLGAQSGFGLGGMSAVHGTQYAVVPQQELLKLQLQALKNSPFGDSPLFRNAVKVMFTKV